MNSHLEKIQALAAKMRHQIELTEEYCKLLEGRNTKAVFLYKNKIGYSQIHNIVRRMDKWKYCLSRLESITEQDIQDMQNKYIALLDIKDVLGTDCKFTQKKIMECISTPELTKARNRMKAKLRAQEQQEQKEVVMHFEDEENIPPPRIRTIMASGAYGSHRNVGSNSAYE